MKTVELLVKILEIHKFKKIIILATMVVNSAKDQDNADVFTIIITNKT